MLCKEQPWICVQALTGTNTQLHTRTHTQPHTQTRTQTRTQPTRRYVLSSHADTLSHTHEHALSYTHEHALSYTRRHAPSRREQVSPPTRLVVSPLGASADLFLYTTLLFAFFALKPADKPGQYSPELPNPCGITGKLSPTSPEIQGRRSTVW